MGVNWNKRNEKWRAQITKDGKIFHGGSFDDEIDAAKAANKLYEENGISPKNHDITGTCQTFDLFEFFSFNSVIMTKIIFSKFFEKSIHFAKNFVVLLFLFSQYHGSPKISAFCMLFMVAKHVYK